VQLIIAWAAGTAAGVILGEHLPPAAARGLDVSFPATFAVLLVQELRQPAARPIAATAGLIAIAAIPFTPPGIPILLAALAVFVALRP
jgi:predicted branched-subunit amino acid permease